MSTRKLGGKIAVCCSAIFATLGGPSAEAAYVVIPAPVPAYSVPIVATTFPVVLQDCPVTTSSNFAQAGKWRKTVDRMAVLDKPHVALAWKGDRPRVMYAWLGKAWYELPGRKGDTAAQTLRRHLTALVSMTESEWNDGWTPALMAQVEAWKYAWMGVVAPYNLW